MESPAISSRGCALVTGGARRIGAAIVQCLHHAGYDIIIHCHQSKPQAEILADTLNAERSGSTHIITADFEDMDAVDVMSAQIDNLEARLSLLVHNASCFWPSASGTVDYTQQERYYRINVLQPLALSLRWEKALMQNHGNIVYITDIHAQKPLQGYVEYCQTKAALWMQAQSLAVAFAPAIRVNAVAPGAIAWPEGQNFLSDASKNAIIKKTLLQKHGSPEDIARAVLFFADNPYITGEVLHVDGGRGRRM